MFHWNSIRKDWRMMLRSIIIYYHFLLVIIISIFHFHSIPVFLEFYVPIFKLWSVLIMKSLKVLLHLYKAKSHVKQVWLRYFNQTVTKQLNSKTGGFMFILQSLCNSQNHVSTEVYTHLPECRGKFMICALYILRYVRRAEAMSNSEKFKPGQQLSLQSHW